MAIVTSKKAVLTYAEAVPLPTYTEVKTVEAVLISVEAVLTSTQAVVTYDEAVVTNSEAVCDQVQIPYSTYCTDPAPILYG